MHFEKKKNLYFERQLHALFFTPMEAKYTHLDNSIPRYHQFDNNYNHEYIH